MEIRNVITFLRVAELGSFTEAANQLGYVQSTVSIQIKQLEKELGVILFDRIGKRVSLTSNGQEFVRYANQLLQITEQARLLAKQPVAIIGELRLGILESLLTWILADRILAYHQDFPRVSIKIKTATQHELFRMLKQNELDMVFLLAKKLFDEELVCAWASSVKLVFVTHPDHPLAAKNEVRLRDLAQQPFILTESNGIYRQTLEETAMQQQLSISPLLTVDNTGIITKMLKQGLGISYLPEYTVAESVSKGELALIDVQDCSIEFWIQLFYHKNKWLNPQMEGLIRLIKALNATKSSAVLPPAT